MTSLLFHVISLPTLLMALLIFGFAPGAVLRIIVLAFERHDPRRRELLGELYNVPRVERPFWVVEQIEVALTEGLGRRLFKTIKRWKADRRLARWWRKEKQDFLNRKYTLGHSLAIYSFSASFAYLAMLLPGNTKIVGAIVWALVGTVRASYQQGYVKHCEQAAEPVRTTRIDAIIFIALGPAVYATTAYMFIHDVVSLISGNMSPGYWYGLFLCLITLWYPWEMTLSTMRALRADNPSPSSSGN
jgi:hypothetical protein